MEGRPGEDQAVEQRDGQAGGQPGAERADRAARRRPVDVDGVGDARVQRRDDVGLTVDREAELRHQRLVEDRVDRLAIVRGA